MCMYVDGWLRQTALMDGMGLSPTKPATRTHTENWRANLIRELMRLCKGVRHMKGGLQKSNMLWGFCSHWTLFLEEACLVFGVVSESDRCVELLENNWKLIAESWLQSSCCIFICDISDLPCLLVTLLVSVVHQSHCLLLAWYSSDSSGPTSSVSVVIAGLVYLVVSFYVLSFPGFSL